MAVAFPPAAPGARIYSKARHLWIRHKPGAHGGSWMGYLSLGDSVRLKGGEATTAQVASGDGEHCRAWYAVEPQGYVCAGSEASLDANDPEIVELARTKADVTSPWPYRYGESLGVPILSALPPSENQPANYRSSSPPLYSVGPGGRIFVPEVVAGSMVAYTDSFDHGGKSYLLSWDRGVIDKSKVRPFPQWQFHGVVLGKEATLPIVFFRGDEGGIEWRRKTDGSFEPTGKRWPRLGWVELGASSEKVGDVVHHQLKSGAWCSGADLGIAREAESIPPLVARGTGPRKTWVDISITNGTLVAYEDRTPVYATLISPGRGGMPVPGVPVLDTASTPTGVFAVHGKFTTATMVSSTRSTLIHTEVQYVQNFEGPYSLHGAYWHDRWGHGKSGGCVNLSPIDSRRLFAWTDPPLPEGWHGMRSIDFPGERTIVSIHR
jgi:hypothetical protein